MSGFFKKNLEKKLSPEFNLHLKTSKVGFEKESLRTSKSKISAEPHPKSLGSALCNKYITTDFSESQLELVTPPFAKSKIALSFLEDIHHFVSLKINNEILWPFSFPPPIEHESDIPIAKFGFSNIGKFKYRYREGLSFRYGRKMQAISGFHYNYSFSEKIWEENCLSYNHANIQEIRSASYMNKLRNSLRYNWLILYLFGSSPLITKNFIANDDVSIKQFDQNTCYLPYATSLRMSDFGYQNIKRNNIRVSMNSIHDYISDIQQATQTPSDLYSKTKDFDNREAKQVNQNVLQIDDEYYAVARAKSKSTDYLRTTNNLKSGGVDFIELRSLDLNPYSRIGIDIDTTLFLEIYSIYCLIIENKNLSKAEQKVIIANDSLVAKKGREPDLKLLKGGKSITLKDWGSKILDELLVIAELLDSEEKEYSKVIFLMKDRVDNPSLTLSGRLLDDILSSKLTFSEYGVSIGESNKAHYKKIRQDNNTNWNLFEKESRDSISEQISLEKQSDQSYQEFLDAYNSE